MWIGELKTAIPQAELAWRCEIHVTNMDLYKLVCAAPVKLSVVLHHTVWIEISQIRTASQGLGVMILVFSRFNSGTRCDGS
jgi:hypothetical protein